MFKRPDIQLGSSSCLNSICGIFVVLSGTWGFVADDLMEKV